MKKIIILCAVCTIAFLAISSFLVYACVEVPANRAFATPKMTGKEVLVTVASLRLDDCPKLESALDHAGIPYLPGDSGSLMTYLVRKQDLKRARVILKADSTQGSYHLNLDH